MTRKIAFFERWSWFKFNNLGLALGTNLESRTSVAKELKLKFRKFWGPNLTFVEVIGEKLVGGHFCPPPHPILNRVKRWSFLKSRPIHFHINSNSVIRPVKRNQLIFSSIELNKPLPAPVYSISKIRFKFRSQFELFPQIRCLITLRLESSIISVYSNITDNIIKKIINV